MHIFERDISAGTWSLCEIVSSPDSRSLDEFGVSVSLSGDTLVVGAQESSVFGPESGAAYVFDRTR